MNERDDDSAKERAGQVAASLYPKFFTFTLYSISESDGADRYVSSIYVEPQDPVIRFKS